MVVQLTDKERDGLDEVFSILNIDYDDYHDGGFLSKISQILHNFFSKLL